jgi:hypothetical protein
MGRALKEKAKRKALRQNEEIRPSKTSNKTIFIVVAAGTLVILVAVFVFFNRSSTKIASNVMVDPDTLPGIQVSQAPWPPELKHLRDRLNIIGLPALPREGTVLHSHQHIDIFIHGKTVPVPADIGINEQERFITLIHTHDPNAVIHIESPTVETFYLGQFFDIWGVRFTSKCIGSYCADQPNALKVFINGEAVTGDPRLIVLAPHQEIVVAYGSPQELPNPIPSQYQFVSGS